MPDLADYIGMPQTAPQRPLLRPANTPTPFSADEFAANANARQRIIDFRRQAPVYQAQQAQLAYDQIAQQANDLRMRQEIDAQAEQAVNSLLPDSLNPESPDYAAKRRDFVLKNPLAVQHPSVRQILDVNDNQFNDVQSRRVNEYKQAEKKRADDAAFILAGGKREQLPLGELERAEVLSQIKPKTGEKSQIPLYEKRGALIQSQIENAIAPNEKHPDYPKFTAKMDDLYRQKAENDRMALEAINSELGLNKPAAAATTSEVVNPAVPTSFQGAMAGATPAVPAPTQTQEQPPFSEANVKRVPILNEASLPVLIADESLPFKERKAYFETLKQMENAQFPDLTHNEVDAKKAAIKYAIQESEPEIKAMEIVQNEFETAYKKVMSDFDQKVAKFAKEHGVLPKNIYKAILKKDKYNTGRYSPSSRWTLPIEVSYTTAILGNESYLNKYLTDIQKKVSKEQLKSAPFATIIKQMFGKYDVTNEDVLMRLAQEKVNGVSVDPALESIKKAEDIMAKQKAAQLNNK